MFVTLVSFTSALLPYAKASGSDLIGSYEYGLYNLKIRVENSPEAYPNQSITLNMTVEASAKLAINYTAIELYTLNSSTMKGEKFAYIEFINYSNPMSLSGGQPPYKISYDATVPASAFNVIYGKLTLDWKEMGTEESNTYTRQTTFIMASVYNPELERMRDLLPKLQIQNAILRRNMTDMNDTLTQALNDLTDARNRYEGDMSNTRSVVTLLGITTVFFVATTVYLIMKKPKDYF
jgi:hypothetical protein